MVNRDSWRAQIKILVLRLRNSGYTEREALKWISTNPALEPDFRELAKRIRQGRDLWTELKK